MRKPAHIMERDFDKTFCGKRHKGNGYSIEYAQQQERNFGLVSLGGWCPKCIKVFKARGIN